MSRIGLPWVISWLRRYPARFKELIVANAPGWFGMIWKMTAPCLAEATRKIFKVTKGKKDLAEALAKVLYAFTCSKQR